MHTLVAKQFVPKDVKPTMIRIKFLSLFCASVSLSVAFATTRARAAFTNSAAIQSFLHDNFSNTNCGMVIGLVDEHGVKIFHAGKLDNGTAQEVDADTLFEIGSITKTFTALLALEMAKRGEINLDDPVANYLPSSVKVPSQGGKQITLLNLAVQDSGLPFNATNFTGHSDKEHYDSYTAAKMYSFLAGYALKDPPGTKYQYSNLGMSLLGKALERVSKTNFESLALERICRPLHLDNTWVTPPRSVRFRMAVGHDDQGKRAPDFNLQVMAPAGALHSTVNDLLRYVAAEIGLTNSPLSPLMQQSQVIRHTDSPDFGKTAMPWVDQNALSPPGSELLGHGGGTLGSTSFVGFDTKQRRGVVVLSNQRYCHSPSVGWTILQGLPPTKESFTNMVREIAGIGAALGVDKGTRLLEITKVFPASPAFNAGLSKGLLIQRIDDNSTVGKTPDACAQLIRGPVGSKVRLEIINATRNQTNTVQLTRQKFTISNG
jgi:CubicO group peptidase (beta-lactamase class C family)